MLCPLGHEARRADSQFTLPHSGVGVKSRTPVVIIKCMLKSKFILSCSFQSIYNGNVTMKSVIAIGSETSEVSVHQ